MKWLAFTSIVVASLVALGIYSVMPPTVVWEGRVPHCPKCRTEINSFAGLCAKCDRPVSWSPNDEECGWCLSKEDVEYLKDSYRDLELGEVKHIGLLAKFPKAYYLVMEPGACAFCAGLGKVEQEEAEVTCPVCRGGKKCVGCDGDREMVIGEEDIHMAWLDRQREWSRARARSELTHLPVRQSRLVDQDVEALIGHEQAEAILDERGSPLLKRAQTRAALAFEALQEAHRSKVKLEPGGD